ncbi:DUF4376 domain-containing protein [Ralstonia solanacearum P673]|uniref:DUF4376 domain-containing protein n=1 Tax=Ralstonia solanacearum TaxID=305 RepID=UPI00044F48C6|nr:DUF4376 domain-containing protein [Ralstonia solanacearum]EUJ15168.1 phage tail protein [Ralstonia solanacearum P673]MCL9851201.1 DUF4376 domain-containing protein [Ralstonia solanacearum]MCL9855778.1 DUF4376 domain-containing protein [Ralstonia solanacearum]MCL9860294.1 DUF4376 domain-containing protein [Ralstonia solanacearum]MCL9865525.1 DUF4376 domain-containing protein [Ralstonia solanacearum]
MGQKFAAYDAQGRIVAYYDSVDSPVPVGVTNTLQITDAQWQACIGTSGYKVVSGALVAPTAPTAEQLLAQEQAAQIAIIEAAYQAAIQQPVSYMAATFQADQGSQDTLAKCLVAGAVPTGMFWLDANNNQVAMTFAQLQGLAGAMLTQGQTAFAKKTSLKAQIRAATTVASVQAVVW